MKYLRGSEWRKWDLHLHTASSYDYKYKEQDADELLCNAFRENNVSAVAITDHFLIDAKRITNLRKLAPEITFFPGVELRTDKGATNIHIILIFSNTIDLDYLKNDFDALMLRDKAKNNGDNKKIYLDFNDIVSFAERKDAIITIHAGRKSNGLDNEITNALDINTAVKEEYASKIDFF